MSDCAALYEQDFHGWWLENAALLRQGRFGEIDVERLAEELETMGRLEVRALRDHLRELLVHLLKWHYRPDRRTPAWRASIYNSRRAIAHLLEESPSLGERLETLADGEYADARFNAANEIGLDTDGLPVAPPFSPSELLDIDYWPD